MMTMMKNKTFDAYQYTDKLLRAGNGDPGLQVMPWNTASN